MRVLPWMALVAVCWVCGCATAPRKLVDNKPSPDAPEGQLSTRSYDTSIADGVGFLEKSQTPEGFWGTGTVTRGTEIYSMVPGSHYGFRTATTALCVMALREAAEAGYAKTGAGTAHDRGLRWLIDHGRAWRDDGTIMYNVWAHFYALQALAVEMRLTSDDAFRSELRAAAEWHLAKLEAYQTYVGGWFYYDFEVRGQKNSNGPASFTNAAGLVALEEARRAGLTIDEKMVGMAKRRLEEMRLPTGAYLYGMYLTYAPRHPGNQERGAAGRSQSGNYALLLTGSEKVGPAEALDGLKMLEEQYAFLEIARKRPFPHETWYVNSGYYFYFAHYYAARLTSRLGPQAAGHAEFLQKQMLGRQEPVGSWWDYAMWDYHEPYGTAYALMALLRTGGKIGEFIDG